MLLPLRTHSAAVANNLVAIILSFGNVEAGDLTLPKTICHIGQRIALVTKTKDDFFAPVCPVFNAY
jgi:hypothetical protein